MVCLWTLEKGLCVRACVCIGGWVGGMHWPIARGVTTLDAPTRNVQYIKGKHADQPTKKLATTYHIHVLPLLNQCGWKQVIFKNVAICKMFCAVLQSTLRN